jgi:hypothetical protein
MITGASWNAPRFGAVSFGPRQAAVPMARAMNNQPDRFFMVVPDAKQAFR